MGRLVTCGFEWNSATEEALQTPYGPTGFTFDTGVKRSGGYSGKFASGTVDTPTRRLDYTGVSGRDYWARGYIYVPTATGWPTTTMDVWSQDVAGVTALASIQITATTGVLRFNYGDAKTNVATASISLDTWYCIETRVRIGAGATDQVEFWLDSAQQGVVTGLSLTDTAVNCIRFGWLGSPAASNRIIYFDDIAVNDDQGAANNTRPGAGSILLLKPASDNNRGGWTGGAGGTTNLWDAVNPLVPGGLATETDASQIESATNSASDPCDFNFETYTAAGLASDLADGGTIAWMQARIVHGEDATTNTKTGSFTVVSNPAQGSSDTFTFGDDGANAAGNYPTGWVLKLGTLIEASAAVAIGTAPVGRVVKTTASTRVATICQFLILADYKPPDTTPKASNDSRALSISDTAAIAATYTDADTRALSISDTAAFTYPLSAGADSRVLTIVDTATVAIPVSATDTSTLTIVDTASGVAAYTDADTRALTSVDTASMAAAYTDADTRALTIVDTASVTSPVQVDDTRALTSVDTAAADAAYTDADTRTLSVADTATFSYPLSASADSRTLSIADTASFTYPISAGADSRVLTISETTALAFSLPDTRTLTIVDAIGLALSTADTRVLSLIDTAVAPAALTATDTRTLSIADSATVPVSAVARRRMILRIG